ncbi:MAG: mechanosensitive ion channel family protein [Lentihominibacter sp.]
MGKIKYVADLGEGWVFVLNIVLMIVLGLAAIKIITIVVKKLLKRMEQVDSSIHTFILNGVRGICYVILIGMVLQMLGVGISTIVAVLGAAGAAIALALKDSLANIAGGIMIIATHPFSKGDLVSINGNRGRVEKIDLFLTTLQTLDRKTITIPNGIINTSVVYNESDRDVRRVDCRFTVSYDTDLDKAKDVLAAVCESCPEILRDPAVDMGVVEHGDSGIVIEVLAYCMVDDYFHVKYYLMETVKKAFEEQGIEIPFPHLDVKLTRR